MPRAGGSSSHNLPTNWPADIEYLTAPRLSKNLSSEALRALSRTGPPLPTTSAFSPPPPPLLPASPGPSPNARIKLIPASSPHPAAGQRGLFALRRLAPGTLVVWYCGLVHAEAESDPTSRYDAVLDRAAGVGVDAARAGNEARFVNDYRGVPLSGPGEERRRGPNAELREAWADLGGGRAELRLGVFVVAAAAGGRAGGGGKAWKGIEKGEEVLVSYGKGFWRDADAAAAASQD